MQKLYFTLASMSASWQKNVGWFSLLYLELGYFWKQSNFQSRGGLNLLSVRDIGMEGGPVGLFAKGIIMELQIKSD